MWVPGNVLCPQVIDVQRVQHLALWQQYVLKRQGIASRHTTMRHDQSIDRSSDTCHPQHSIVIRCMQFAGLRLEWDVVGLEQKVAHFSLPYLSVVH